MVRFEESYELLLVLHNVFCNYMKLLVLMKSYHLAPFLVKVVPKCVSFVSIHPMKSQVYQICQCFGSVSGYIIFPWI